MCRLICMNAEEYVQIKVYVCGQRVCRLKYACDRVRVD